MFKKALIVFVLFMAGTIEASDGGLKQRRLRPSSRARAMEPIVLSQAEFQACEAAVGQAINDLAAKNAARGSRIIKRLRQNEAAIEGAATRVGCCVALWCAATIGGAMIYFNEMKKSQ